MTAASTPSPSPVVWRFRGHILGVGTVEGTRIVVGVWPDSPLGSFADVMVERADGHRLLLAPTPQVADFVTATYRFDEVRIAPVTADLTAGALTVTTPSLTLTAHLGRRRPLGWALRLVPASVASHPAFCALSDPIARVVMPGVRTRGTAGQGRREFYGATDVRDVVGIGARCYLAALADSSPESARLVAAADTAPDAAERAERLLPEGVAVVGDHRDLLECGLDAVVLTTPDDTHEELACFFLEAGIPVYLEKPLAITIESADRILATARRTGTRLYVGHNMRHMEVVRLLKSIIDSGRIGELKAIWCRHFVGNGGDYYFRDWHAERRHVTGLLLQKAAHDIDVMSWLAASEVNSRATDTNSLRLSRRAPSCGSFEFSNSALYPVASKMVESSSPKSGWPVTSSRMDGI